MRSTDIEPLARVAVVEAMTATFFQYIDWISQQVVADELDRLQRLVRELGEATNAAATPLFVAADRISA